MKPQLVFVTGNPNKALEAERILGFSLLRVFLSLPELQAKTLEDITRHKIEVARARGYDRLIVEDVSLGLDALGGFPGPYVKWLLEMAGGQGLGALAYALRERTATARCCVGYWDGKEIRLITGEAQGEILIQPRGDTGFGWDAWFVPQGFQRTFAELEPEEKDRVSHRGKAYRQLKELLEMEEASVK